jgi:hypothetical protein
MPRSMQPRPRSHPRSTRSLVRSCQICPSLLLRTSRPCKLVTSACVLQASHVTPKLRSKLRFELGGKMDGYGPAPRFQDPAMRRLGGEIVATL